MFYWTRRRVIGSIVSAAVATSAPLAFGQITYPPPTEPIPPPESDPTLQPRPRGNRLPASTWPAVDPVIEGGFEQISTGHSWVEAPVWIGGRGGYLLFSDVPRSIIYKWDGRQTTEFLNPSGWAEPRRPDIIREGGVNGIVPARGGIVVCDSGNRCISWIDLKTKKRTVLTERFNGQRYNSPNDLTLARNGDLYFSDPPWGLIDVEKSPHREMTYSGVFRLTPKNEVHLITDKLFPNGIALSPDNRTLYSSSRAGWMAYSLDRNGNVLGERVYVPSTVTGGGGDGMKIDRFGNLWATSRGHFHVFSPKGERFGMIEMPSGGSNLGWGPNNTIFISSGTDILRARISDRFLKLAAEKARA